MTNEEVRKIEEEEQAQGWLRQQQQQGGRQQQQQRARREEGGSRGMEVDNVGLDLGVGDGDDLWDADGQAVAAQQVPRKRQKRTQVIEEDEEGDDDGSGGEGHGGGADDDGLADVSDGAGAAAGQERGARKRGGGAGRGRIGGAAGSRRGGSSDGAGGAGGAGGGGGVQKPKGLLGAPALGPEQPLDVEIDGYHFQVRAGYMWCLGRHKPVDPMRFIGCWIVLCVGTCLFVCRCFRQHVHALLAAVSPRSKVHVSMLFAEWSCPPSLPMLRTPKPLSPP